jgi:hypothetical protein
MSNGSDENEIVRNKDYWHNELRSLGIAPEGLTQLNDNNELCELTDNIKQSMFRGYKTAYSLKFVKKSHFEYLTSHFDYIV